MSWQRIQGHGHLIEAFNRAVQRGRLAHAYLFVGPPGVGKHLFAQELAKALLCENTPPAPPSKGGERRSPPPYEGGAGGVAACNQCTSCTLFDAGTHPDFFAVGRPEDKNEVPIEVMLELCRNFGLKSARGHGKVGILDDADDLNDASANCFLKTLEEPPPHSVFVLIGTSLEGQLPTVVSRCQVVRFSALPEQTVVELLRTQELDAKAPVEEAARLSGGSVGQALALADPELWEFRRVLLGGLSQPQPDTVALAKKWIEFAEDAGKEAPAQRRRALLALRLLVDFLHDALAMATGAAPRNQNKEDMRLLQAFTSQTDADAILKMLDRCLEAEFQINRYVQLTLVLEGLVDSLGQTLALSTASR